MVFTFETVCLFGSMTPPHFMQNPHVGPNDWIINPYGLGDFFTLLWS